MDAQDHPDLFHEATARALQRAMRLAYAAATGAQILVHLRRTHNHITAQAEEAAAEALRRQLAADHAAARAIWAPALDAGWLRQSDLIQAARAWGAAMPFADQTDLWHDPAAAKAMSHCEERLRDLHPYGMQRYDQLRSEGRTPGEAMREAAPFFAYEPRPRRQGYAPPACPDGDGGAGTACLEAGLSARHPGRSHLSR